MGAGTAGHAANTGLETTLVARRHFRGHVNVHEQVDVGAGAMQLVQLSGSEPPCAHVPWDATIGVTVKEQSFEYTVGSGGHAHV